MKKILTHEEYKKFLDLVNYDYLDHEVIEDNQRLMRESVKELVDAQLNRFGENGRKVGCCFNFSFYLFAKYKGMFLTCRDLPGIHCAFVYVGEDGNLYVCDPAKAKIENDGNDYFNIPINEYSHVENRLKTIDIKQVYRIYHEMFSDDNTQSFLKFFRDDGSTLNFKQTADIDEDKKNVILNIINKNLTTSVE